MAQTSLEKRTKKALLALGARPAPRVERATGSFIYVFRDRQINWGTPPPHLVLLKGTLTHLGWETYHASSVSPYEFKGKRTYYVLNENTFERVGNSKSVDTAYKCVPENFYTVPSLTQGAQMFVHDTPTNRVPT